MARRLPKSREEKVAEQITQMLEPVTIDLDEVGRNIARMNNVHYNRLIVVTESAEWEKKKAYDQIGTE